MTPNVSALIIGYQRLSGVQINIENCVRNGIQNIFVSIDYPKVGNIESMSRYNAILDYLSQISVSEGLDIYVRSSKSNIGCAVNVVTACEWFFSNCDFGVILEDDCRPNDSFFSFAREALTDLSSSKDTWMICGTQLVPTPQIGGDRIFSVYPQVWGWATSSEKWSEIRSVFFREEKVQWPKCVTLAEKTYWKSGEKRAREGFLDAWDIILASEMRRRVKFAITPRFNLVSNIGVDEHSTHTIANSQWMAHPVHHFEKLNDEIILDNEANMWLRDNFYKIRFRHIFSTKFTALLDRLIPSRKGFLPLKDRLKPDFVYLPKSY
jgi:hypothetical protein